MNETNAQRRTAARRRIATRDGRRRGDGTDARRPTGGHETHSWTGRLHFFLHTRETDENLWQPKTVFLELELERKNARMCALRRVWLCRGERKERACPESRQSINQGAWPAEDPVCSRQHEHPCQHRFLLRLIGASTSCMYRAKKRGVSFTL